MRTAAPVLLLLVLLSAGCDKTTTLAPSPQPPVPNPSTGQSDVIAVYAATFTASVSCESALPEIARERSFTATLHSSGVIQWTGPTINPWPDSNTFSSGTLSDDAFSFSVDIDRDPMSDDFNGISDDLGNGRFLSISGKGVGGVRDAEIAGTFSGLFAYYEVLPRQPWWLIKGPAAHRIIDQVRQRVTGTRPPIFEPGGNGHGTIYRTGVDRIVQRRMFRESLPSSRSNCAGTGRTEPFSGTGAISCRAERQRGLDGD